VTVRHVYPLDSIFDPSPAEHVSWSPWAIAPSCFLPREEAAQPLADPYLSRGSRLSATNLGPLKARFYQVKSSRGH